MKSVRALKCVVVRLGRGEIVAHNGRRCSELIDHYSVSLLRAFSVFRLGVTLAHLSLLAENSTRYLGFLGRRKSPRHP